MAIYTPRGLKIRLPIDHTFALIARLYPNYSAFKVLQTTEAIELMPKALTAIAGIVCFLLDLNWSTIVIITFLTSILAHSLDLIGLLFKSLISFGRLYSLISGYGILIVGIVILGFFTVGWKGVLAFFAAKLVAAFFVGILNNWQLNRIHKKTGLAVTASERHFFHAYRFYAMKVGASLDLEVDQNELKEQNWQPAFLDLSYNWPEVVARFN